MTEKNHRPEDRHLASLFANNRLWSASRIRQDPKFFSRLASQQAPAYLWIGCSDSRVPANEIIGLEPGEVFVHRNVANLVLHSDMNCLSVLQYAVEVLNVSDVIVCGHYGCGGVSTAVEPRSRGLISNWLRPIRELAELNAVELASLDGHARNDRLCELNVIRQVHNVANTTIVQDAWHRGQTLAVHGLCYGVGDGLLRDLEVTLHGEDGKN
ncbi:MAG: carbonate dehydratase [Gammaproteobacteria bacterium]|nr:carbonate dehydratase [Gammaproteobacteria bacterium]